MQAYTEAAKGMTEVSLLIGLFCGIPCHKYAKYVLLFNLHKGISVFETIIATIATENSWE